LRHHVEARPTGRRLAVLSLTALGVVYGDIGTSPLYAIKECFKPEYGLRMNATNIYGVLSLIVWALILVVSVKYVAYILRADNKGEGGVLALLALVLQRQHRHADRRRRMLLIALGLFGGAFLYGDGIITPAISVLSAVEGLDVVTPALRHFVLPIAFAGNLGDTARAADTAGAQPVVRHPVLRRPPDTVVRRARSSGPRLYRR
jgi:KUP system potassium uptake protein